MSDHHDANEAMNSRVAEHYRAEREGRVCRCGHLGPDHWDWVWNWSNAETGRCGVADCDCLQYRYDGVKGSEMRIRESEAEADRNRLKRAMRTSERRRRASGTSWEEAVERSTKGPLPFPDQPGVSRKRDDAVLDALKQIGGNPDDLPA